MANDNGNKIEYTGRITALPEYKATKNSALLSLRIAENHREKVNGEWVDSETPTWHNVTVWNGDDNFADELAADPAINKGALVRVSARYITEAFEDKDGNKRTSLKETALSVKVLFAPKEPQPAVRPASDDGFIPAEDDAF